MILTRDQDVAQTIYRVERRLKGRPITVVVGAFHAPRVRWLLEQLRARGAKA
jgi:hypothetical protein